LFGLSEKLVAEAVEKAVEKIVGRIKDEYGQDLVSMLLEKIVDRISEDEKWRNLILESLVQAVVTAFKKGNEE
jgi:hypothetical protein